MRAWQCLIDSVTGAGREATLKRPMEAGGEEGAMSSAESYVWDFPDGPPHKNLPANAVNMDLIPGPRREIWNHDLSLKKEKDPQALDVLEKNSKG